MKDKVVLITGGAKRVGAEVVRHLHALGYRVVVHTRHSSAEPLLNELNAKRKDSAVSLQADLSDMKAIERLAQDALKIFGRIDALVNNASSFYPTPVGKIDEAVWDDLMNINAKAPLFLTQALAGELKKNQGAVVNMVDIHVERPLKDFHVYSMSKAALEMLTKTLARALAPDVRVNAVAPGIILWGESEKDFSEEKKAQMIKRVPLQRQGEAKDIAETIAFLLQQKYINGQIIAVDGGRRLAV
ncbi:MAG: pteridine reductase [Gammaproteobacteria bacterium CG11_big_fil_rev_8_21_14_0_20_46_22]|nr:MAG: pteridine reductase [Gammaproteobacteria bacterium CG12_big_fil_rev_8_21_14_0_65_46_12]PIR11499.1 MAG: pteridine reductase [Gammaproteobacteria bacterium CG11_big_fil_rev_8_21_14_0_20_46_22]